MLAAVVLRDQLGMSYADIAEGLDLPVGTAKSRVFRGRQALAALLGPTYTEVRHGA